MDTYFITTYRYRDGLRSDDYRDLTKMFTEVGNGPGVITHYSRLDGKGGVFVQKVVPGQEEKALEVVLEYAPWVDFESFPVTTIEEAFPVIQRVYG